VSNSSEADYQTWNGSVNNVKLIYLEIDKEGMGLVPSFHVYLTCLHRYIALVLGRESNKKLFVNLLVHVTLVKKVNNTQLAMLISLICI